MAEFVSRKHVLFELTSRDLEQRSPQQVSGGPINLAEPGEPTSGPAAAHRELQNFISVRVSSPSQPGSTLEVARRQLEDFLRKILSKSVIFLLFFKLGKPYVNPPFLKIVS